MAAAAGQAVDAGAGRIRLAAGAHGLAVGQVQARKLCGFERVNVAWQFVAIAPATVLTATLTTLAATGWTTAFRTRTARCGTALAVATVVKTRVAALLLATTTFAASIALAFKARCALWAIAA